MSGRQSFDKLRQKMDADPERRRRVEEKKRAFDALLDLAELAELRKSRGITQAELAERLGVSQPNVAKIEAVSKSEETSPGKSGVANIYLSTLAGYVEALGGHLELRATFPEHPETDVSVTVPVRISSGNDSPEDAFSGEALADSRKD